MKVRNNKEMLAGGINQSNEQNKGMRYKKFQG